MFSNPLTSQRRKPGASQGQEPPQTSTGTPGIPSFAPLATPPMRNLTFPQQSGEVRLKPMEQKGGFGVGDAQDGGIPFGPADANGATTPDIGSLIQQLLSRQGRR